MMAASFGRAALATAAVIAFGAPQSAPAEELHATLAIPAINLGFIARYVAEDEGFWKTAGLDVKILHIQGIGSMNAVISGSADFSMSSGPSITRANARGQKLVALATAIDQSDEYIVIRKEIAEKAHFDPSAPLATRGKILEGKTMAVGGAAAIPDIVLKVVAKLSGVPRESITTTPMVPTEFMAAFERKAIDGFVSGPPFTQQALIEGSGVLVSNSAKGEPTQYSPVSSALLLTRASFCGDHRAVCEKMVHGVVEAARFIHSHPEETIAIMKKHFGQYGDKVLEASYEALAAMTGVPPVTTPKALENADLMNIEAGFMKESDKLKDYAAIIDNEFTK
ncbi:MAG TPA: ABC transporter substrate-binding protein [Stellaceae bacterium]|nr:ABC transporter substrate-binding protein [Stellaceae bacterium]